MNTKQLKEFYYHNFDRKGTKRNGSHEDHDVASLSTRLMLSPEDIEALLTAGHLQPVSTNEDGSRLGFESDHLDEIRKHVVDHCSDDAEAGAATNGNFAAARALVNLQRRSELAIAKHQQLVRLNRLASIRPDIEFGLGAELLEGGASIAKKFLGSSIGQSTVGHGAIGAGIGSVIGGGKALLHNIVDPSQHESVLGGALGGAAIGGVAGAGYGAVKGAGGATPGLPNNPAGPMKPPGGMGGMKQANATVVTPSSGGGSPSPGGSDPTGGNTPWWRKYNQTSTSQPQTINASSRRSTINFGATYEDIVLHKFAELKAAGVPELKAKSQAFDFGVKRHSSAYADYRMRGGTIDFGSQPQTVATRRIAGVADAAQGDIDPETQRILAKVHRLNGRKVAMPTTASM